MILQDEKDAKSYILENFDAVAVEKLELFIALLKEENTKQNLISAGSLDAVWLRHIADSAQLLQYVPRETSWLDLGSGAGLPGIIVAILQAQTIVNLVESRKRRIEWLFGLVRQLELKNGQVHGARLEDISTFKVGAITARAFAPLPRLIQSAARFSTKETVWVLPKGRSALEERNSLPNRQKLLFHVEQSISSADAGILIGTGL